MRANGKNVTLKEFGKPCSTKVGTLSKKISKLNIKNGMKISPKRYKPKLKSHKKVVSCVGKRIRNGSSDRKLVSNRTSKSYKKQKKHFSSHQSETLPNSCRDLEKQDNVDVKSQKLKKRKKWRRQRDNAELDEASRLQRRTRYLLVRMKLEQNLIDAYSGEGWKGQSREKIKPEKELQRAKKQILKCKLGIRDVIRQLDLLSSVGCIENSVIAPDGSVHHEHIICANCKLQEAFPDNDIILCDGTCNCAFHQKCLDPPLLTENIPPGDQGWFCKFCESKMEIIETTNAHLGTHFSADSHWQDIFREEAALPDGQGALEEEEWPSDDSEDDDYDPDKIENSHSYIRVGSETDGSVDLGSSTSLWSLEDEVLSESKSLSNRSKGGLNAYFGSNVCVNSNETSDCEILSGPRQRRAVDYKKLYDEMFGKDAPVSEQISEDEDWGPSKRKRREKESDAASTLMTLSVSKKKFTNAYIMEGKENGGMSKRQFFRIPHDAVEKLRIVFAENELPSRATRENLSKELGLDFEKVNKWFKNARYMALKARKVEKTNHFDCVSPKINKKSGSEISKDNAADPTASNDFSSAPKDHQSKHLKKGHRRKHPLSLANSTKQNLHNRALLSGNKADEEIDADVSLKILLAFAKKTKKKSLTSKAEGKILEPEAELERLFKMKDKIEKLQHVLQRFRNRKSGKTDKSIIDGHSESVVYVPVAELVEKQ